MAKFTKGSSGNPAGRPKGSRNNGVLLREAFQANNSSIEEYLKKLVARAYDTHDEHNGLFNKLLCERVIPALKSTDQSICLDNFPTKLNEQIDYLIQSTTNGSLTPEQSQKISTLIELKQDISATQLLEKVAGLDSLERIEKALED